MENTVSVQIGSRKFTLTEESNTGQSPSGMPLLVDGTLAAEERVRKMLEKELGISPKSGMITHETTGI